MGSENLDNEKIGALIAGLRHKKGWTQMQLAECLHISDRTVSKWERGAGLPDVSLLGSLSEVLGVNIEALLSGEQGENKKMSGNMKKAKYYVCPACGELTLAVGEAQVSCCGRRLEAKTPQKAAESDGLQVERLEEEWFITAEHPMTKEHYISFVAMVSGQQIILCKQYPEWDLQVRLPRQARGMLLWYCTQHGLFYQNI